MYIAVNWTFFEDVEHLLNQLDVEKLLRKNVRSPKTTVIHVDRLSQAFDHSTALGMFEWRRGSREVLKWFDLSLRLARRAAQLAPRQGSDLFGDEFPFHVSSYISQLRDGKFDETLLAKLPDFATWRDKIEPIPSYYDAAHIEALKTGKYPADFAEFTNWFQQLLPSPVFCETQEVYGALIQNQKDRRKLVSSIELLVQLYAKRKGDFLYDQSIIGGGNAGDQLVDIRLASIFDYMSIKSREKIASRLDFHLWVYGHDR